MCRKLSAQTVDDSNEDQSQEFWEEQGSELRVCCQQVRVTGGISNFPIHSSLMLFSGKSLHALFCRLVGR